jgi:hypothetical protein
VTKKKKTLPAILERNFFFWLGVGRENDLDIIEIGISD